ncbi:MULTISPECIES: helix-turn-helix domain-containing protein [unclassified Bacillus (in: firmicutes)]|uniref:helix-turn-helix domain-containing protein n=1 Tax=unclassified Bacillus (in: firmicutes) TaxID=185979 RepID=UPI0008E65AA1|nr:MULTISPECIES: helix-turn-helix domain-containing protein [unclassified Bacillus (in: firmicutes)]SFB25646.1 hypothetical protein SAMN02799634_1156 [Bacillus sp. UNCCL13]SFQ91791.1 hypothetical protein SAMN04488577_0170 [Bacillus sp. cl95]
MRFYTIKELCERTNKTRANIQHWIKIGRLPNTTKNGSNYQIPESDVINLEKVYLSTEIPKGYITMKNAIQVFGFSKTKIFNVIKDNNVPFISLKSSREHYYQESELRKYLEVSVKDECIFPKGYLSLEDTAIRLNLTKKDILNLIESNVFISPSVYKDEKIISIQEVKLYEKKQIDRDFLTVEEVSNSLNLASEKIRKMINMDIFPNVIKSPFNGQIYLVPSLDVKNYQLFISKYITITDAAKLLDISNTTINKLIRQSFFNDVIIHKVTNKKMILKSEVQEYGKTLLIPDGYTLLNNAAKKVSRHPQILKNYFHQKKHFQKTLKIKGRMYIHEQDISEFLKVSSLPEGYITVQDACKKLSRDDSTVLTLLHNGEFPNAYFCKYLNKYVIPDTELEDYIKRKTIPEGYIHLEECARLLACTEEDIKQLIKRKHFNSVKRNNNQVILISKKEIETYLHLREIPKEYFSLEQAAEHLNISSVELQTLIENKEINGINPNKFRLNNTDLLIKKEDVVHYKRFSVIDYSIEAIELFNQKVSKLVYPNELAKTIVLFNKFALMQIGKTNGISKTFRTKALHLYNTLNSIVELLDKDIFLAFDNEIDAILNNTSLPDSHKITFTYFLIFCTKEVDCTFKKQYKVEYKDNHRIDKEIYDKETFLTFYSYVSSNENLNSHISNAILSYTYAKTWLFVIMHMINAWRKNTIISELPNLEIEQIKDVNILSFEFFSNNNLSFEECQRIINHYSLACGKVYISKNRAFGQFLCNKDMVIPTATALIICELHRRKNKKNTLLGTPTSFGNTNSRFSKFFSTNFELPPFSSLKMNRSLLTHFFYVVTESGIHPEISNQAASRMRSHTNKDSISQYIQATNKDGSLDKVSVNLFNRGHFGWLYNFIISLTFGENSRTFDLEQRTLLIQSYKADFSPNQLEGISYFLLQQQSERQNTMTYLRNMAKDQLKDTIMKLLKGEMPARMPHTQCISYPECPYPSRITCMGCSNLIPKDYVLLNIVEELKSLSNSIRKTEFELIRYRDTLYILQILDIINQAINDLGKEFVSTFLDFNALVLLMNDNKKYMKFNQPSKFSQKNNLLSN